MEAIQTKYCNSCQQNKSVSDFYPNLNSRAKDKLQNNCKNCAKEIRRKHYYDNRDMILEEKRDEGNKKRINEKRRLRYHRIKHTPQYKLLRRKKMQDRRARIIKAEGSGLTLAQINELLKDANNICFWCEQDIPPGELVFDHIYPLAKGGEHDKNNIAISCRNCNSHKSDKEPEVFLEEILAMRN